MDIFGKREYHKACFVLQKTISNPMKNILRLIGILFLIFATSACSVKTNDCKVNDQDISGKYYGECSNGLANGSGNAEGRDKYIGQFKDGKPHGKGLYEWGASSSWAGEKYDGDWIDGERVYGKYISGNKSIYIGDFSNSLPHGYGVFQYNTKNKDIEQVMQNGEFDQSLTKRGFWFKGNYAFACIDRKDCLEQLSAGQEKILEKFRASKEDRKNITLMKDMFSISQCHVINPKNSAEECLSMATGPIASMVAMMRNKNQSLTDFSEVKAGFYPPKSKVVIAGLGYAASEILSLAASPLDTAPAMVNISNLDPDTKYSILQFCSSPISRCTLIVHANVRSTSPIVELTALSIANVDEINRFTKEFSYLESLVEKVEYREDILKFILYLMGNSRNIF